jgi:hypothetical protein
MPLPKLFADDAEVLLPNDGNSEGSNGAKPLPLLLFGLFDIVVVADSDGPVPGGGGVACPPFEPKKARISLEFCLRKRSPETAPLSDLEPSIPSHYKYARRFL